MVTSGDAAAAARGAYEALAPSYDVLTADYAHDSWLAALEELVAAHGLSGRRVLDVACGTGKSFLPLLRRGYEVTGCDISPAMLAQARAKAPGVVLEEADMRALPVLGEFDLVTCLDDALNYLEAGDELLAALQGLRRNLAPAGIAVWDVNTEAMYRKAFAQTWAAESDDGLVLWRGGASDAFAPGGLARVVIDVFEPAAGGWTRTTSSHRQRHWPAAAVAATARAAGLRILALRGQHHGVRLERRLDESVHPKAVFVACRDDRPREGVRGMSIGRP